MHNNLTNLLPLERRRSLARDYFLRLGVIISTFLTMIILVAGILLIPTYVFLAASSSAKEARLADIKSKLSSADEAMLSVRLAALANSVATLTTLESAPSASAVFRTMLAVSRPGITLSDFVYKPAVLKTPGTLVLSGTSATRDALRNYQLALEKVPSILSANLPISAYAKDVDISFAISVTLAP